MLQDHTRSIWDDGISMSISMCLHGVRSFVLKVGKKNDRLRPMGICTGIVANSSPFLEGLFQSLPALKNPPPHLFVQSFPFC